GMLGREMQNCLAEGSQHHRAYGRALRNNTASFWVLRDHLGVALMAAMIHAATGRVMEVRGRRNAPVLDTDADFAILVPRRATTTIGAAGLVSAERRRAAN